MPQSLVAIPLKQGQVFNKEGVFITPFVAVAIPLKQGQVFNYVLFTGLSVV